MQNPPVKRLRRKAKQGRAKHTVDAILTAASQVLVREGCGCATADRIAARAGVSVGTVYQYFHNKSDIIDQMFDRESDLLIERLDAFAVDEGLGIEANVASFILIGGGNARLSPELYTELERMPRMRPKLEHLRERVIASTSRFVKSLCPDLTAENRQVTARLIALCAEGLGAGASRGDLDGGLLREFNRMISGYLVSSMNARSSRGIG